MYHRPDHRSHSGIGKATDLSPVGRGAHVPVGGRDAARGSAVVASIQAKTARAAGRSVFGHRTRLR
jgi:hypothetical protein